MSYFEFALKSFLWKKEFISIRNWELLNKKNFLFIFWYYLKIFYFYFCYFYKQSINKFELKIKKILELCFVQFDTDRLKPFATIQNKIKCKCFSQNIDKNIVWMQENEERRTYIFFSVSLSFFLSFHYYFFLSSFFPLFFRYRKIFDYPILQILVWRKFWMQIKMSHLKLETGSTEKLEQ